MTAAMYTHKQQIFFLSKHYTFVVLQVKKTIGINVKFHPTPSASLFMKQELSI